jgi:hypothetical protein
MHVHFRCERRYFGNYLDYKTRVVNRNDDRVRKVFKEEK